MEKLTEEQIEELRDAFMNQAGDMPLQSKDLGKVRRGGRFSIVLYCFSYCSV